MRAPLAVDAGGFKLAAYIDGQPEGAPWIVLSTSVGAASFMWEPQLEWLGRRYRILRYDTRGHGASDTPPGAYSFSDLAVDVIRLMDGLGIAKASFMGLSLGGMTGLGLAIDHGGRFDRIVCCDARADSPPAFVQGWDDRLAAIDRGGMEAIVGATMERWFVERWRKANPDRLKQFEDTFVRTKGFRGCAEALKRLDYLKDLGKVAIPMLYVAGAKDPGAPPDVMRAMAAATPGAQFAEIPDAAHLPNVDNTQAFNAAISGFLGLA